MFRRLLCGLALVVLVGCGGNDDPEPPSATIAPAETPDKTTSTTEALTPEEEVEAAYLRSWDVYAKAVLELDDSRLAEVYDGDALELRREEISDYREANTPGLIEVKHNYAISFFDEGRRALVVDTYINHSVFIDPETEEPTESDPNKLTKQQFELRQVEGKWRVVFVKELA